MCGIAGIFELGRTSTEDVLRRRVVAMTETLRRRGPDDAGDWVDAEAGIALGQRRLAIIDISPFGHQPMVSADGRLVINYNGELYNVPELREPLKAGGARFRGHSDTEVLVEACARWGVERALKMLAGMFALALWDRETRRLILARDRLGIKPLYWTVSGGTFLFASELKALRAFPGFRADIDREAVAGYLRYGYVPAPRSIYAGVHKLPPGHMLVVDAETREPRVTPFWSLETAAQAAMASPFKGDENDAAEALDVLLRDVVGRHMVSDVPLGAFLSGGIDSSAVVALMQSQSAEPIRTYCIGVPAAGYDESAHAAAVARHLGTCHESVAVSPEDAFAIIPSLPDQFDEPFADSSQIPTFLVSRLASRSVRVALSGDGGDEMFGGYNRYRLAHSYQAMARLVPTGLRRAAAAAIMAVRPEHLDRLASLLPASRRPPQPGDKLHKLAAILHEDADGFYRRLVSQWPDPALLLAGDAPQGPMLPLDRAAFLPDVVDRMQYLDTLTYLPDDILTKVDRASMWVSLEARVPFLDNRVIDFAWSLPRSFKVRGGEGKRVLRRVLDRYVPRRLTDRPKTGFGIPIGSWLRGPLRDWAEGLLAADRLSSGGLLRADPIRKAWQEHLSGRRNWQYQLWTVLMLQAWRERWT